MVETITPPQLQPQYIAIPTASGWSFTQGFLLGQFSIVVIIGLFIKFFIFGEPPSSDSLTRAQRLRARSFPSANRPALSVTTLGSDTPHNAHHAKKISSVIRPSPPLTTAAILAKTYYNVKGHQPESLDWFNVLVAQTIAQLRSDAQQDNAILTSLTSVLNGPGMPDFLGPIRVTEINLGEEFPIFSNCRVIPVGDGDNSVEGPGAAARLQARMDVDLSDTITIGVETKLLLNYPKPLVAVLPVALSVSVIRFSGTLSISFIPSDPSSPPATHTTNTPTTTYSKHSSDPHPPLPADPTPPTSLTFSFLPDYRLELSTHSLLGSRSRLQDIPKIAQLLEARLHAWFDERCVEPRFQQILLPSMWPRKRNTRGGEAELGEGEEGIASVKSTPRKREDTVGRVQMPPPLLAAATSINASQHRSGSPARTHTSPAQATATSSALHHAASSSITNNNITKPQHTSQPAASRTLSRPSSARPTDGFVSGRQLEANMHLRHATPTPKSAHGDGDGDGDGDVADGIGTGYQMPGSMPI